MMDYLFYPRKNTKKEEFKNIFAIFRVYSRANFISFNNRHFEFFIFDNSPNRASESAIRASVCK